jgi:hypothetical protein
VGRQGGNKQSGVDWQRLGGFRELGGLKYISPADNFLYVCVEVAAVAGCLQGNKEEKYFQKN